MKKIRIVLLASVLTLGPAVAVFGQSDPRVQTTAQPPAQLTAAEISASRFPTKAVSGPMESQRDEIIGMINQARDNGVGVTQYEQLFNSIEDKVKAGATANEINPIVNRLFDALSAQSRQAESAKNQTYTAAINNKRKKTLIKPEKFTKAEKQLAAMKKEAALRERELKRTKQQKR